MSLQLFGQPFSSYTWKMLFALGRTRPRSRDWSERQSTPRSALDIRLRPVGTWRPFFVPAAILVLV